MWFHIICENQCIMIKLNYEILLLNKSSNLSTTSYKNTLHLWTTIFRIIMPSIQHKCPSNKGNASRPSTSSIRWSSLMPINALWRLGRTWNVGLSSADTSRVRPLFLYWPPVRAVPYTWAPQCCLENDHKKILKCEPEWTSTNQHAPWRKDGKGPENSSLLSSSSLANHGG